MPKRTKQLMGIILSLCMVMSVFFNSMAVVLADGNVIESVTITSVPVMELGASIEDSKMTFDAPEGCIADSYWLVWDEAEEDFVKVEEGTFTAVDVYRLEAEFTTAEGYEFTEDFLEVNNESGIDGDYTFGIEEEDGSTTYYYVMPIVSLATAIQRIDVTFPEIVPGNVLQIDEIVAYSGDAVVDIENFEISVEWMSDNGEEYEEADGKVVEDGYVYSLDFDMDAKEGYYFDEVVEVYFNGVEEDYAYENPKCVNVWTEYNLMPALEKIELMGMPEGKAGDIMPETLEATIDPEELGLEISVYWYDEEGDEATGLAMEEGKAYTAYIDVYSYSYTPISSDFLFVVDGVEYEPTEIYSKYQAGLEIEYNLGYNGEEEPDDSEDDRSDDIVILYTNDVHTYIDGTISYDVIAGVKDYLQTQYKHVLLVDAGDHIQGTAYGSMDKGKTIIDLMNAADYDAATLGNHEFDYGMTGRINVTDEWAYFPYTSCNFYYEETGYTVLNSYIPYEMGDELIAIVGITTPESFTKSTPAYFQDEEGNYIYGISGGADGAELYADVQKAVDEARADGATKVIALGHLGDDTSSSPWTSEETIANVTGIDAFIDGHSHSTVVGKEVADKDGEEVLLTQTGEYFNTIGMMVIDAETGEITTELLGEEHEIIAAAEPDEYVKELKEEWMNEIDEELGQVIGKANVTFDNYDAEGKRLVRSQSTNSGAFAADALYYLFDNMDMDVDVALMNGGGVRNKAITGDISYKTCKEIHTLGNVACLQTVTGQQLLDALEWGARGIPNEEIGGFLHGAGITYEVDSTIPSTVQMDDKGVWVGGPTGEYRVKNVKVHNKETNAYEALDLNASYNLAGYNYTLRDLGDGFAMFDGAVNVLDYVMEDYMVLANYVQGFEDGIINADNSPLNAKYSALNINYAEVTGDGRFAIIDEAEEDATEAPTEKPEEGTTEAPAEDNKDKAPATGDEGILLYVMVSVIALLAMGATVLVKKQNMN